MEIVNFLYESWKTTEIDERTQDWFFCKHQIYLPIMFFSYLYFVLRCGPRYMEHRKAYTLKTFIWYYNIFQIVYNAWLVYSCIKYGMFTEIGIGCVFVNRSPEGNPMSLVHVYYWTLILKIVDLSETVVFVLRKKHRQISFLHLYHHVSTIYLSHMALRYYPGGMATIAIVINCSIHVMMYTYYLLSSMGPKVQKAINPIKPYITIIQMVQFFVMLAHTIQALLPSCTVPKWGALLMFFNLVMNFILFYNFYRQNYNKKREPKQKAN